MWVLVTEHRDGQRGSAVASLTGHKTFKGLTDEILAWQMERCGAGTAPLKIGTVAIMNKKILAAGVAFWLLAATGCSGSGSEDDSPPPAGGINGPAIVDPDAEIGSVNDSGD